MHHAFVAGTGSPGDSPWKAAGAASPATEGHPADADSTATGHSEMTAWPPENLNAARAHVDASPTRKAEFPASLRLTKLMIPAEESLIIAGPSKSAREATQGGILAFSGTGEGGRRYPSQSTMAGGTATHLIEEQQTWQLSTSIWDILVLSVPARAVWDAAVHSRR